MNLDFFRGRNNADTVTVLVTPTDTVEVLKYLPIDDKKDLINLAIQNSKTNDIYSPLLLDMYFHLYIAYLYTDIEFTAEDKLNPTLTYDILVSSGVMEAILQAIPEKELLFLEGHLRNTVTKMETYHASIGSVINDFVNNMPIKAQDALKIMKEFDPDEFKAVTAFAKAANGDRDIV